MLTITVSPQRSTPPQYNPDDGGKIVAWYKNAISSAQGSTLSLPTPDCVDVAPSVASSVVVRAVVEGLSLRPTLAVALQCTSVQEQTLYRQIYNLWFAQTKEERL